MVWDNAAGVYDVFVNVINRKTHQELNMSLIDNFLLLKFHFFQHYYPEAAQVMEGRKYGFNIVSQLLKLFVIFPAVSALAAWVCTFIDKGVRI